VRGHLHTKSFQQRLRTLGFSSLKSQERESKKRNREGVTGKRVLQEVGNADEKDENQSTDRLERMSSPATRVQINVREVMMKTGKVKYAASAWAGRRTAQVYRSARGAGCEYWEIEVSIELLWIRQTGSYTPSISKRTSDREHGYVQRCDVRATEQYASILQIVRGNCDEQRMESTSGHRWDEIHESGSVE
jgi:hypothetical protein